MWNVAPNIDMFMASGQVLLLLALQSTLALTLPGSAAPASTTSFWRGKRCLIAGASSGLGEALAQELSRRDASLVIAARREDRLLSIAAECATIAGCEPSVLTMDVTAEPDVLAAKAREATALLGGGIDVLLYTAGCGQRTVASATSAEAHTQLMRTNFEGAVSLSRALCPAMVERGR